LEKIEKYLTCGGDGIYWHPKV